MIAAILYITVFSYYHQGRDPLCKQKHLQKIVCPCFHKIFKSVEKTMSEASLLPQYRTPYYLNPTPAPCTLYLY